MRKKTNIKKYPSGGYLDFMDGNKGFSPIKYYQDNQYFRTVMPDKIENIDERINSSSFMGDLSDGVSTANRGLNDVLGMAQQFKGLFGNHNIMDNPIYNQSYIQQNPNNFTQDTQGIPSILGGAEKLEGLGQGVGGNWGISSMMKFPDGGEVQKMYNGTGRQSLGMFGNSYGSPYGQPHRFNSGRRMGAGAYTKATANDWMHTKLGNDRQEFEDNKVDWGIFNWAKEPVSFGLGMVANTAGALVGLDDDFNDSFMGRTTGGKIGGGLGKTGFGALKGAAGVVTGNPGMVLDGIGDIGQGTVGTISNINADMSMDNYDKEGYISNKRTQRDMDYFNNMIDQLGGMYGNVNSFGNSNNLFNLPGFKQAEGGVINRQPIQAEKFEGQPEQIVTPDGQIQSTNAQTSHEQMGDDHITDELPVGSHIQSARNSLNMKEIDELLKHIDPKQAETVKGKLEQVYKDKYGSKKNKEISPADITEYAKNKFQKKSTPNSFDSDKLKEGNKKEYSDLGIEINELLKMGNEIGKMSQGGRVNKYPWGTDSNGLSVWTPGGDDPLTRNINDISDLLDIGYTGGDIGVDLSNYSPLLIPQGIKNYNYKMQGPISYNDPNYSNEGWNPLSRQSYEWFRTNANSLNTFGDKTKDFFVSPEYKAFEDLRQNPNKYNQKQSKEIMDKAQAVRQKTAYSQNPEFYNDIIATSYVPTWDTVKSIKNPKFQSWLKSKGIDTSTSGGYSKLKGLSADELKEGYSNLNQEERANLINPQALDGLYDRRVENFQKRQFISESQRDEWARRNGLQMHKSGWMYDPKNPNNVIIPEVHRLKSTSSGVENTDNKKAENLTAPIPNQIPVSQRFNDPRFFQGLLNKQLQTGLQGNSEMLNQLLSQSPTYYMETPDTYIKSRINEIPVDNTLYNIERANRNSNQFLRDNTSDWSTLAGNTLNNSANMYNQIGNQLSAINEKNVGLYNTTQGLEQGLLENNMTVRNRNLGNMQEMMNKKKEWMGDFAVKNADKYNSYYNQMNQNRQQEDNQKLHMLSILGSAPDQFKGRYGQMLENEIMNRNATYDNQFQDMPILDMLGGNSQSNLSTFFNIFKKKK